MPYITRFTTTSNGAITFTGNTLGLSKQANANNPGTSNSIGTFITTAAILKDGGYPNGTTASYLLNSSSAQLVLPAQSAVLYAELIWGGSYNLGGENVTSALNNPVTLITPTGFFSVAPDAATAVTNSSRYFYVRSSNVTALVQAGGAGTYTAGRIPGTQGDSENSLNHAGWTLAVVYENPTLPSRNMTVFVGGELVDPQLGSTTATVSGFSTPTSGAVNARLLVSAQEGDSDLTGDQLLFGPTASTLSAVSGPNNPVNNFFASQVNDDSGLLNTTGTFGTLNSSPGTTSSGRRQGWDITNINVSSRLTTSQTSAAIRGSTNGDVYLINALGLQVDINAPIINAVKSANRTEAFVGDTISYTVQISNTGTASSSKTVFRDTLPAGTSFVSGSVAFNGTAQPAANPFNSISLGNLTPGQQLTITYRVTVTSRPEPPQIVNQAELTYQFQSIVGGTVLNGRIVSNTNVVVAGNFPPVAVDQTVTTPEDTSYTGQLTASDTDGGTIVFALLGAPLHGTTVIAANGSYVYTPAANYNGADSFTFIANDGQGGSDTGKVTITVLPVNDAPVAPHVAVTTPEDLPVSGKVAASDVDGDALAFTLSGLPLNGTAALAADGSFVYTPAPNFNGTDSFTVLVSDGNGGTATAVVTVTVTPVNDPPVTANIAISTLEDTPVSGAVAASDVDGDPLSFTLAGPPLNGTAAVAANGAFTYTPAANFFGTDSFSVRVSDGQGGTAISVVTVTVAPVNDAPVGADLALTTAEDTPVSGQAAAVDADGDALVFSLASPPANGSALVSPAGAFTYTPNLNFFGSDSFTLLVSDGLGGTDTITVTVTVNPVNDPPVAANVAISTQEDTPVNGQVTASDVDGDPLLFTLAGSPANGTVYVAPNGLFTYTPAANFFGSDSFRVLVSDGQGGTAVSVVSITVTPVNDPPIAADQTISTPEDTAVAGRIAASDVDGDALTYSLSVPPANGTAVVHADGTFLYTPAADFNGTDTFTVLVSDGNGGTDEAAVTVIVVPVNDPAIAQDALITTPEDTPVAGQVIAYDPEGDPLTFTLTVPPAHGMAVVQPNGSYLYTPDANYFGPDSFTVSVTDGLGNFDSALISITVLPVNDAPVTPNVTITTPEDTAVTNVLTAFDADGDALTFTLLTNPLHGTAALNTDGAFTYSPNPDYNGSDTFIFQVSDGQGGTAVGSVTIVIVPVNDPPVLDDLAISLPEDTSFAGLLTGTDVDGDALTYSLEGQAAHGTASVSPDGTFTYVPEPDFNGTDAFVVLVSDGNGGADTAQVTVTVTPVNDPPAAVNQTVTMPEDTAFAGQIEAVDIDGDTLSFAVISAPLNGSLTLAPDGAFTYTPTANFNGVDSFLFTVDDGNGGTASGSVTILVTPVNDPPIVLGESFTTAEDTPLFGQIAATDADGDALTFTVSAPPSNGSVSLSADGQFTYTPALNFNGEDSFSVTVSDGQGGTADAVIAITVTPVNDVPVAFPAAFQIAEDSVYSGQLSATDADGDALAFSLLTTPANGSATVNQDGTFTYTPNANYFGTDAFTFLVDDGNGGQASAEVQIQVLPVNDPPTAVSSAFTIAEDTELTGQLGAADIDGDRLQFRLASGAVRGTVFISADGAFSYRPDENFNGTDSFTFSVDDGQGGIAVGTVTITVTPVNDPPVAYAAVLTTLEDVPVSGQLEASDIDGDALTFSLGRAPGNGTAVVNADGAFIYAPALNFNGDDSFTIVVADGNGGAAEADVTILVTPVNDPPTAADISLTTPEDTSVTGTVAASDPDGDPLTYSLTVPAANGIVSLLADGSFTYTPALDFSGTDSFTITVSDGQGGFASAAVTVTVIEVNDPAIADDLLMTTAEDTQVIGQISARDPEGQPLSFSLQGAPAHGTVFVSPTGAFTYVPELNFNGIDSFTVFVSDPLGGSDTALVTIQVLPVNDAPVAENLTAAIDEDTAFLGRLLAFDVDGDPLTFALSTNPANGIAFVEPDGTVRYTPNTNFNGIDSFTALVSDGQGGTAISVITITVNPVNDPPVVSDGFISTSEDTPFSGRVAASDPDNDLLTYGLLSSPANGAVQLQADGSFLYTPNLDFNGTDSFSVLVDDGNGGTATATFTVQVVPVNDPPTIADLNVFTDEDTPLFGQITASDADSDPLVFALGAAAVHGTASVHSDGSFVYTPAPDFNGTDSFTVTVNDGSGGTAEATVTIFIAPVNDAPVAQDTAIVLAEDTSQTGRLLAADADQDALTFTLLKGPLHGNAVVLADGSFTYTPNPDFNGEDSFTVLVEDGNGGSDTAVVTVTVTPVNDPPVASDLAISTLEDVAVSGIAQALDVDGDALAFSLAVPPARGTVFVGTDGRFTYTPNSNVNGTDTFTLLVDDGNGGTDTAVVTVSIVPVNDAPTARDTDWTTAEDTPFSGKVPAADVDGDALQYALTLPPQQGVVLLDSASGNFTYTPNPNVFGADSFIVEVSDGFGGTASATVRITIYPVNDPPEADDVFVETSQDIPVSGRVTATDIDGDVLAFTLASGPQNGTVLLATDGNFTYTPNPLFYGPDSFIVQVDDGNGGVDAAVVSVSVIAVSAGPVAQSLVLFTKENTPVSAQVTAFSADGSPLEFSLNTGPIAGTVTVNPDGTFTYTPPANFSGADSFTVTVIDSNGGISFALSIVTVLVTPNTITVSNAAITIEEDTVGSGQITATDPGGNPLTYSVYSQPARGTAAIDADTGVFSYTPDANFNGIDSFTVLVSAGQDGFDYAIVTVTVTPVNDPPEVGNVSIVIPKNTFFTGMIPAVDVDGDSLAFSMGAFPTFGAVSLQPDGSFTYTPNLGYVGPDSFTVNVTDGLESVASAVTIQVTSQNEPPTAVDLSLTVAEDTPLSGQMAASDPDGDALVFTVSVYPANGSVSLQPDGSFIYTPNTNFNGMDSFIVSVADGRGGIDTASVMITVTPVNDPPGAAPIFLSLLEDTAVQGAVQAFDVDGDPLTYALASSPAFGTATVQANGAFVYTPNPDFFGADSFIVSVNDGQGGVTNVTVTLDVRPVNDPPVTSPVSLMTAEDTPVTGTIPAFDADGDALFFALSSSPRHGAAELRPDGTFIYSPDINYFGPDTFSVQISDGQGGIATSTVSIVVTPVNDAPTAPDVSAETLEDTPVSGRIAAADAENDPLTFAIAGQPQNGAVVVGADGLFTYTPNANYNGPDSFTVSVSDGQGGIAYSTVTIAVLPVNDPPIAADVTFVTTEDTPVSGIVTASDADGDALVFRLDAAPLNGIALVNDDGTFTYTPNADYNGPDSFTVRVSDGQGGCMVATVFLTITPVNDAPVLNDAYFTTLEDTPLQGVLNAFDVDGDALNFTLAAFPSLGMVMLQANGTFVYTPNPNANGIDQFAVLVDDGAGGTALAQVRICITPVNDPPATTDLLLQTPQDTPLYGQVFATDADGDTLTFRLATLPANGAVTVQPNGAFTYQPRLNFAGADSFTVAVDDGQGGISFATVILDVTERNDPPVIDNPDIQLSILRGQQAAGQVAASDPEGEAVSFSLAEGPINGSAVVNADGSFAYTPNPDFIGTDSFRIQAEDASGAASFATVTVTVVNLPPQPDHPIIITREDTPASGRVSAVDPEGDALFFALEQQAANGIAAVDASGGFVYTPNSDFFGSDSFIVKVSDPFGGTALSTVIVAVTAVNDLPVAVPSQMTLVTQEDTSVSGKINAYDPDGDPLVFTLYTPPVNGTAVLQPDGSFVYTPRPNFVGADSFAVRVSDPQGASALATVLVQVEAVNDVPEAADGYYETRMNIPVAGHIAASDADLDPLTFRLDSPPQNGTVILQLDGRFIYTPGPNFTGTDSFTVLVSDNQGGYTIATVIIQVNAVNRAPVADDLTLVTRENRPISGEIRAIDPEGGPLLYELAASPANGTVKLLADDRFLYTPQPRYVGQDVFQVRVIDTAGSVTIATVTIVIRRRRNPIFARNRTFATKENTPIRRRLIARHAKGLRVAFELAESPQFGTADVSRNGTFIYTPVEDFIGTDRFRVAVFDRLGNRITITVTIQVTILDEE